VRPEYTDLWERLDQSRVQGKHDEFRELLKSFLAPEVPRIPLLKQALRGRGKHTAVFVLKMLTNDELFPLFDELVWVASNSVGYVQAVRNAILRLPHEWLMQHIESVADPILRDGTYEEYRRILELYRMLDRELTLKLARRALAQNDADIQEAGQDAVDWFAEK
jgi:hypothetical protein